MKAQFEVTTLQVHLLSKALRLFVRKRQWESAKLSIQRRGVCVCPPQKARRLLHAPELCLGLSHRVPRE